MPDGGVAVVRSHLFGGYLDSSKMTRSAWLHIRTSQHVPQIGANAHNRMVAWRIDRNEDGPISAFGNLTPRGSSNKINQSEMLHRNSNTFGAGSVRLGQSGLMVKVKWSFELCA